MATKKPPNKPPKTPKNASGAADQANLKKLCTYIRTTVSGLARAEQMVQAKGLYEKLHPETKQGGARGKAGGGKTKNATVAGFVTFMSRETGLAARTINYDVEIGTGIAPEVKKEIAGTPLANCTRELIAICNLPTARQRTVVKTLHREGLSGVKKQLHEWTPRTKQPIGPDVATCEVTLDVPAEVRLGVRRFVVKLLAMDAGRARLEIGAAQAVAATQKTSPGNEAEPTPEQLAEAESILAEARKPRVGPDWARLRELATEPMTEDEVDAVFAEPEAATKATAVRLAIDSDEDAFTAVYGDLAKQFVLNAMSRTPTTAKKYARNAGLKLFGEINPMPGLTVIVGYGTRDMGVWTFGIGQLDEAGELPVDVYAANSGPEHPGKGIAYRVKRDDPALGKVRCIWAADTSGEAFAP